MRKELPVVILIVTIVLAGTAGAQSSDDFTSTASLFTIGTGARPLGMGNAFVGLADDTNALFYNPAGLAFLKKSSFNSFYTNQFTCFHYGSVGYAHPNVGLSYRQLSSGTLTKRDLYGNPIGEFSYTSRGLIGASALRLESLGVALQGKLFTVTTPSRGMGYSLSPSLLYLLKPFRFGVIFKNLLSVDITYDDDHREPWHRELTMGIAYCGERVKLDLDVDALLTERGIDPEVARIGAEGELFPNVLLRAGITSKLQSSLGVSLKIKNWRFDYSYQFHDELASTHRLSFTVTKLEPLLDSLLNKFL